MLFFYLSIIDNDTDRNKFLNVYNNYLDWMLKIAFHFLENQADAEDAVQDVFLDMAMYSMRNIPDSPNELKAYLFICIRNRTAKILQEKGKTNYINFDALYNIASDENTEKNTIESEEKEQLLFQINKLPKMYKDILTLYYFYELKVPEISRHLKISIKTAETRFRRGKLMLKNNLRT